MSNVSYSIFSNPKQLTTFASGKNWLIGLTSEKKEILLARIKPLLEADDFDPDKIQNTIYTFIDWFIDDYEKREKKECTLDDKEIVESVGIALIDKSGKIIIHTYGRFKFYKVANDSVAPLTGSDEKLSANEMLIANPKNADISKSILDIENKHPLESDSIKYESFLYPFALIKLIHDGKSTAVVSKKNYSREIFATLFLLAVGITGLLYKDQIKTYFPTSTDSSNSAIITPDTSHAENQIVTKPPAQSYAPIKKNEDTETPELMAEGYYQKAEDLLSFARAFMEDGKNRKALYKLDSAEYFYGKYLQLKPEKRKNIQQKLNELQSRKILINGNNL